jgi:hypothetical protein
MEFGEALSGGLPSPRDDEPSGLRQDIIDELADHLALGVQRERLRGNDAATARARAVERFGDPAAVACRLWTDAMKGKFMAQRAVIVTCALVAAASLSSVAILWRELAQARRIAVDQAAAQLAEARASQQQMLQQLKGLSESVNRLRATNLSDVRINLVDEFADESPVAGASLALTCVSEDPRKQVHRTSDASGCASFGTLAPGDYEIEIRRSWGDGSMSTTGKLDVQPGKDVNKLIVCPNIPPRRAGICVRWKWPADLEREPLVVNASFAFRGVESASGLRWSIYPKIAERRFGLQETENSSGIECLPLTHSILCGASNKVERFRISRGLLLWRLSSGNGGYPSFESLTERAERDKPDPSEFAHALDEDIDTSINHSTELNVEVGKYELSELLVLRPVQSPDGEGDLRRFKVLAGVRAPHYTRDIHESSNPPTKGDQKAASPYTVGAWRIESGVLGPLSKATVELPREFWLREKEQLVAAPGQSNEWRIPFPDELIRAVRAALKAEKAPKDKPAAKGEANKGNG